MRDGETYLLGSAGRYSFRIEDVTASLVLWALSAYVEVMVHTSLKKLNIACMRVLTAPSKVRISSITKKFPRFAVPLIAQ